jgi:hypothetical protein
MAEDYQLKKNLECPEGDASVDSRNETPANESKFLLNAESVRGDRRALLRFLEDYKIIEDSFIMSEDYDVKSAGELDPPKEQKLEKAKLNKLRTAWFTMVFSTLGELSNALDLNPKVLKDLRAELDRLIQLECELVKESLASDKLDLSDTSALINRIKGLKKEVAPQLLEDKKRLIESLDFQLKRALQVLDNVYGKEE